MESSKIKWIAGSVAFLLPTVAMAYTRTVNPSTPEVFWISLIVAAIVPPALVLSTSAKRRIAMAFGLVLLLVVQVCLIFAVLLAGFRS